MLDSGDVGLVESCCLCNTSLRELATFDHVVDNIHKPGLTETFLRIWKAKLRENISAFEFNLYFCYSRS